MLQGHAEKKSLYYRVSIGPYRALSGPIGIPSGPSDDQLLEHVDEGHSKSRA